jgi:hypothetical protein
MTTHFPLPTDLTTGSVLLDIGGDSGALLIHTGADLVGEEIEVERVDDGQRTHVAVLTRRVGALVTHAAVFASLRAGDYLVAAAATTVRVSGGEITSLDWRPPQPSPPPAGPPNPSVRVAATAR